MKQKRAIKKIFKNTPVRVEYAPLSSNNGITNRVSLKENVLQYDVEFSDGSKVDFVGKKKSPYIIAAGIKMMGRSDILLILSLVFAHKVFGYNKSTVRESLIYNGVAEHLEKYMPTVYGTYESRPLNTSFVAMKMFSGDKKVGNKDVYRIIDAISEFHCYYHDKPYEMKRLCINEYTAKDYRRAKKAIKRLFNSMTEENIRIFGNKKNRIINGFIDNIDTEYKKVASRKTLTHNDFSDRNISIDNENICIYDWELCCCQNPEHDIIELIVSVYDGADGAEMKDMIDYYYSRYGTDVTEKMKYALLRFNLLEYCVNKLGVMRSADIKLNTCYAQRPMRNVALMMDVLDIDS